MEIQQSLLDFLAAVGWLPQYAALGISRRQLNSKHKAYRLVEVQDALQGSNAGKNGF
jgi:hypothetical protein